MNGRMISVLKILTRVSRKFSAKPLALVLFHYPVKNFTLDTIWGCYKDPAEIEKFLLETVTVTDKLRPVYNLKAAGE